MRLRTFLLLFYTGTALQAGLGQNKNIILTNNFIEVELSAEKLFLPVKIVPLGKTNLLSDKEIFRTVYTYLDGSNKIHCADEDNSLEGNFRVVAEKIIAPSPLAWQCELKSDHFFITRTITLSDNAPSLDIGYKYQCINEVRINRPTLYFPYMPLAREFDKRLFMLYREGRIWPLEAKKNNINFSQHYPFATPFIAVSSEAQCGVCLLPLAAKNIGIFAGGNNNVVIPKGASFEISFSLTYLPHVSENIISNVISGVEKITDKRGIAVNMAEYAFGLKNEKDPESSLKALKICFEALELYPDYAEAYSGIAYCYQNLKDPLNKAKYWLKALELDPANTSYMEWSANSICQCVSEGKMPTNTIAQALDLHKKSIAIDPDGVFHHASIADTYMFLKQYEPALFHYKKAVFLLKNNCDNENYKAKYLPRYEKIIATLEKKVKPEVQ